MAQGILNLVKTKLHIVMAEKEKVDSNIGRITASARSALNGDINDTNIIRKINFELDTVLEFLLGHGAETAENLESASSTKEPDSPQISPASSSSLTELSSDMAHRSRNTPGASDISKLYHRIEVLEAALPTCRSEISQTESKLSTKLEEVEAKIKSDRDQMLNEMEQRVTDAEERWESRIEEVDEQLEDVTRNCDIVMKQRDSRLEKVEKHLKKMETTGKQDDTRLENLEKEVEDLKIQFGKAAQSSKVDRLGKEVETLTSQYNQMQEKIGDVEKVKKTTEEMSLKMERLADKTDVIDIMKSTREMKISLDELSSRADATESFVKNTLSLRDKEENKKREFEDRLLVLESHRREDLENNMEKLKEVESKLNTALQQMSAMTAKVTNLETLNQRIKVRFTAIPTVSIPVTAFTAITGFNRLRSNIGNNYDKNTGIFVSPCDGRYVTSLTIIQEGEGEIEACVSHEKSPSGDMDDVCFTKTTMNKTSCCVVGVVDMKKGDQLYVETWNVVGNVKLSGRSSFSCFLIN